MGANQEINFDLIPENYEGIVIRKSLDFDGKETGSPMQLEAIIQIYTPEGQQYQTWINHDRRLIFYVKDLRTNEIQVSSVVDGGWNIARKGISVQMHNPPMPTEEQFSQDHPANKILRKHLYAELDDQLPSLYAAPATLEIYAKYSGFDFVSNTIRLELNNTSEN